MNWIELTTEEQLEKLKENSKQRPVLIFKHSTRCSISSMAKNRLDKLNDTGDAELYYLDLIRYRPISNKIAADFHVHHESPQTLLIIKGECVFEESHNGISAEETEDEIKKWRSNLSS